MRNVLAPSELFDQKTFEFVCEEKGLVVSRDYYHPEQIRRFVERYKIKPLLNGHDENDEDYPYFYNYDASITDENFRRASHEFTPGKSYTALFFKLNIKGPGSLESLLGYVKKEKLIAGGAHGLTLLWEQMRNKLPKTTFITGYDYNDSLPWIEDFNDYGVPSIKERPCRDLLDWYDKEYTNLREDTPEELRAKRGKWKFILFPYRALEMNFTQVHGGKTVNTKKELFVFFREE